jgi:hypothetical protein
LTFGWKIWLISFLNGKAFTLNKTNKTYIVEWNFQAVMLACLPACLLACLPALMFLTLPAPTHVLARVMAA